MDLAKIIECCANMEVAYRTNRTSEERKAWLQIWYKLFKEEDPELFSKAIELAIKDCTFEPRPVDVQKHLSSLKKPSDSMTPEIAWQKLREKARKGWDSNRIKQCLINNNQPIVLKAMEAVTWHEICYTPHNEMKWLEKRFIEHYKEFAQDRKVKELSHTQAKNFLSILEKKGGRGRIAQDPIPRTKEFSCRLEEFKSGSFHKTSIQKITKTE